MKTKLKIIPLLVIFTFLSCKNDPNIAYQFANKPMALNCINQNPKLYNEALYSFEADILQFYGKNNPNQSLLLAYSQFVHSAVLGRVKYDAIVSTHSKNIFEALKNEPGLWDTKNKRSYLNYNSNFFICLANNIEDKNLKTTLSALISTNSMSPKLFGSALTSKFSYAIKDKALASYMAFDLYYAKLFDLDLTILNTEKQEIKVDFNKLPQK